MKRFLFFLATFFFLFGAVQAYRADGKKPQQETTYHALIIGNNQYKYLRPLKTAKNDAVEVERLLKDKFHFKTELLLDATRADILDRINGLRKRLRKEDNLLIYYAGHGDYKKEAEKAYWLPVDAQRDSNTNWIIVDDITSNIKMIASRHILVISDSCYSGTLAREAITELLTGEREEYLKKMVGRPSRTLMASGGNEPVSDSGGGNNSVFADALLKSLKETGKDAFTAQEIFPRIKEIVAGRSDQIPEYSNIRNSGHDGGDFVFVLPKQIAGLKIQEREEKDKFTIDDLEKKDKVDRATWNTKLKNMKTAFEKAEQFEKKKGAPGLKIAAWQRFLETFQEKNPYSDEDTRLREKAGERINHWQSEKKALEEAWAKLEAKKKEAEEKKKQAAEEKRLEAERLKEEKKQKQIEAKQKQEEERQRLEEEKQQKEGMKAKQGDKAAWDAELKKMKAAFKKVEEYEKKKVAPGFKILAWQRFLDTYQEKNPYSDEDTLLRGKAGERIDHWQTKKTALEEKKAKKEEEPAAKEEKPAPPLWTPKPPPPPPPPPPEPTPPSTYTDPVTSIEMVPIKGGCYQMGDTFGDGYYNEKPVHEACVDNFYLGKYEVTQGQWKAIMGNNPSHFKPGDNYPVENVSYYDVQEFIRKLNEKTGKKYRLPTEAEWEYAARSGGKKEKWAGTNNDSELGAYVWYDGNSGGRTHPVGEKRPNGLGLYDMSGNVWEWCEEIFGRDAINRLTLVVRGGAWDYGPGPVLAANRNNFTPGHKFGNLGFRLAMTTEKKGKQAVEETRQKKEEGRKRLEEEKKVKVEASSPTSYTDPITGMEFVLVKGGCFQMGDTFGDGASDEKPVHEVCLDDFYMGKYEVTQGQWKVLMGENPSKKNPLFINTNAYPVENVSWNDTQEFIKKLNQQTGKIYRLPTEVEWEYAARSGGKNEKWAGTNNESELETYAWYNSNSTHPIGKKRPNSLGLYDMSGNVWEWVQDIYSYDAYKYHPRNDPIYKIGLKHVIRGGGWSYTPKDVRAFIRGNGNPDSKDNSIGFRLAHPR